MILADPRNITVQSLRSGFSLAMSGLVLEKELGLIRQRLEAIEDALGKEMTVKDKAALEEALREHRKRKSIPFRPRRSRTRKH